MLMIFVPQISIVILAQQRIAMWMVIIFQLNRNVTNVFMF